MRSRQPEPDRASARLQERRGEEGLSRPAGKGSASVVAIRHLALGVLAAVGFGLLACSPARTGSAPVPAEAVVRDLYAAHQPWGDRAVALDDPATLARFFDPPLARLLLADSACAKSRKEICNLDFDPVYDAQDFEAGKPLPTLGSEPSGADRRVRATIDNFGKRTLLFTVTPTPAGWRISDITYPDGRSLRTILSRPVE